MKTYTYILSGEDQKRLYLKGYWRHPVRFIGLTVFLPVLVALSFFLIGKNILTGIGADSVLEITSAGFGLLIAVSFCLLPYLFILKYRFSGRKISFEITDFSFDVTEGGRTVRIDAANIKKIRIKGNYIAVKLKHQKRKELFLDTSLITPKPDTFRENILSVWQQGRSKNNGK